jgi:hypothetical protein
LNPVFAQLVRIRNRCFVARSLFLWHQIIGESCGAVPLLRQLAGTIVQVPLGSDVVTQYLPIAACPEGFDIQPKALPNADALFAYIPISGLRLEMTASLPPRPGVLSSALNQHVGNAVAIRRIRVVDAAGVLYRRQNSERFMLRYRLDQAVLQARDLLFLQATREDTSTLSPLPPLRAWIEIDRGGEKTAARVLVETVETSAAMLVPGEAIRLSSFAPDALAAERDNEDVRGVYLYIEMTGDEIDVQMLGETLLS